MMHDIKECIRIFKAVSQNPPNFGCDCNRCNAAKAGDIEEFVKLYNRDNHTKIDYEIIEKLMVLI